jgi:hypothetical protein
MKSPKIDTSGTERAQRAIAEAQAAASNLQKNFQTDLKTENMTQVTPGAGADAVVPEATPKRKRQGSGLSSQLGINL